VIARSDRKVAAALAVEGWALTQALAAAPQLVARWENAVESNPYLWALLTAAIDATRLGVRSPLTAVLLQEAAPDYCSPLQKARAPADWFQQALTAATAEVLYGHAAALEPTAAGMGQVDGYRVADYLLQHGSRVRHAERPPAGLWDALCKHVDSPEAAARLGRAAESRLLRSYARAFYASAADGGESSARDAVARLLEREDIDGLRGRADAGDEVAARHLTDLLSSLGDVDGLRAQIDAGDREAPGRLAELLKKRGDVDGLLERAATGDSRAALSLTMLLLERGDVDGLRICAAAGDDVADVALAVALIRRGDSDAQGWLRDRADSGNSWAGIWLAVVLRERGDVDELRVRADGGEAWFVTSLTGLLVERRDVDELQSRANDGCWSSAAQLADLLAERGDVDGLRSLADAGDAWAVDRLIEYQIEHHPWDVDLEELRAGARASQNLLASRQCAAWLAETLAKRGDFDELRSRADAGDWPAAAQLAGLLAGRRDLEGLQHLANIGNAWAGHALTDLLAGLLAPVDANRLRRFGLKPDGSIADRP
jgi:hypothetical protein